MIGLLLFTIVGIALFIGFLTISLQGIPKGVPDSSALTAVSQMVTLEGVSFANPNRLLDDTEYQILRSHPDLRQIAKRFREDRQELALLWISSLLSDLKKLRRFRQFLIQQGARARFGEELDIQQAFIGSVIFLILLKVSIHTMGPFVFTRGMSRAKRAVDRMSFATAGALARIPPTGWPEIERSWTGMAA